MSGPLLYVIDLKKNTAFKDKNPAFAKMVEIVQETGDPLALTKHLMKYRETGDKEVILGEECSFYESALSTDCITKDGIVLKSLVLGGVSVKLATRVDRTSGGDDEAYQVPATIEVVDRRSNRKKNISKEN